MDLRHYLDDETGDLADMPGPALNCAFYFGSIVAWVSDHLPGGEPHTNVPCWRRPGAQALLGRHHRRASTGLVRHPVPLSAVGRERCHPWMGRHALEPSARFRSDRELVTPSGVVHTTPTNGARWL